MLFLLPGMGADHRMYAAAPWHALPEAQFLDWPEHHGEGSITAIAARIIAEAGIRDGDAVIGSSLGGGVGCEIANQLRLHSLVLIGSAQSPTEISTLLALMHPTECVSLLQTRRPWPARRPPRS